MNWSKWSDFLVKGWFWKELLTVNPLTLMSDQDRISPYNINTISSRQVMRMNIGEKKCQLGDNY